MPKRLKMPTLLVIADNPSVRFWVKKHLDEQFFLILATKRQEALDALNANLDFIILDGSFESCDPLALCKEISLVAQKNLTPILLITGRLKKSYRDQALDAGVTDFLSNELDQEELDTRIATGLKAAQVRQKTEELSSAIKLPKRAEGNSYLKNRFVLNDQTVRFLAQARKEKTPVITLLIQIDRFDEIQKKRGDEILLPFSNLLHRCIRDTDLIVPSTEGRFLILLPNTTAQTAKPIAESMRKKIEQHRFETKTGPLQLTCSIVISSSMDANETSFKRMVDLASNSLKQIKKVSNQILTLDQETA